MAKKIKLNSGNPDDFWSILNKKYDNPQRVELVEIGYQTADDVVSTGSLGLDLITGIGGYPVGRSSLIVGEPGTGKSTLAIIAAINAQKRGYSTLYIDTEQAFYPPYAAKLGLEKDDSTFSVFRPDTAEQAFSAMMIAAETSSFKVLILDSIANMPTEAMMDNEMGDHNMAGSSKIIAQFLRNSAAIIRRNGIFLIMINQYRQPLAGYSKKKIIPGGRMVEYTPSLIIDLSRREVITGSNKMPIGTSVVAKIIKNRMGPPMRSAKFDLIFGEGISQEGEIFDNAVEFGIIKKSGSWVKDERIDLSVQGKEAYCKHLRENPEYKQEMLDCIMDIMKLHAGEIEAEFVDEESE